MDPWKPEPPELETVTKALAAFLLMLTLVGLVKLFGR
jgi:hypothetical protein